MKTAILSILFSLASLCYGAPGDVVSLGEDVNATFRLNATSMTVEPDIAPLKDLNSDLGAPNNRFHKIYAGEVVTTSGTLAPGSSNYAQINPAAEQTGAINLASATLNRLHIDQSITGPSGSIQASMLQGGNTSYIQNGTTPQSASFSVDLASAALMKAGAYVSTGTLAVGGDSTLNGNLTIGDVLTDTVQVNAGTTTYTDKHVLNFGNRAYLDGNGSSMRLRLGTSFDNFTVADGDGIGGIGFTSNGSITDGKGTAVATIGSGFTRSLSLSSVSVGGANGHVYLSSAGSLSTDRPCLAGYKRSDPNTCVNDGSIAYVQILSSSPTGTGTAWATLTVSALYGSEAKFITSIAECFINSGGAAVGGVDLRLRATGSSLVLGNQESACAATEDLASNRSFDNSLTQPFPLNSSFQLDYSCQIAGTPKTTNRCRLLMVGYKD